MWQKIASMVYTYGAWAKNDNGNQSKKGKNLTLDPCDQLF